MMVCRGGAELLSLDWALKWNVGISHKGFTAQVRRGVLCCFPQANLDILITRGEQVTQDLQQAEVGHKK